MSVHDREPGEGESDGRLLEAVRRELARVPRFGPARERALVERILARTTGAPRRTRPSLARQAALAAALLLAGTTLFLAFPRRAAPPARSAAPARALPVPDGEVASVSALPDVLSLARAQLTAAASAPRAHAGRIEADAPLELRLLDARARGLRERRWDPWLREVSLAELGTLAMALWCEVQLDRYVLSGDRPPAWKRAVDILRRDLERPETPRESSRLLAHALHRARDYGLADGIELAQLEPVAPWSGQWFDDLDAAGRAAGVAGTGTWRAWVDWRGR